MEKTKTAFGQALVNVRKELGVTQYQLSKRSKLHENYLNRLENGKIDPRASTILRITRALEIKAGVLLEEQQRLEDSGWTPAAEVEETSED